MHGEEVELVAAHQSPDEMAPYERLLGDAMHGEETLFVREDSVEAQWRIVDPILGNLTPVYEYAPHTWGPPEADQLIANKHLRKNSEHDCLLPHAERFDKLWQ